MHVVHRCIPVLAALFGMALSVSARATGDLEPGGYLVDWSARHRVLAAVQRGDAEIVDAFKELIENAEREMGTPIVPVTAGKAELDLPLPTDDPRDYISMSPYWWPNPDSPDGLPYVRRDGETNPERDEFDTPKLGAVGRAVRVLAFAYFFTGEERYAERAAEHLRAWFVDPETRMNPRMRFAQFIPGVSIGRAVGIIDTNRILFVPDSVAMISSSPAWSSEDDRATRAWFGEYAEWLITSELGKAEQRAKNNHGSWHSSQVCLYARFAGNEELARMAIRRALQRVETQIEPDGSQPHELARTKALDYTEFALRPYIDMAVHGEALGIDVLGYKSPSGASVMDAVYWSAPYWSGREEWTYPQITKRKNYNYFKTLRRVANLTDDASLEAEAQRIADLGPEYSWAKLAFPSTIDRD